MERGRLFLQNVVYNLCIPEGISGNIDLALKISRQKIIAKILRELADKLEEEL